MSVTLPTLDLAEFSKSLDQALGTKLPDDILRRLWFHYEELCQWSPRLSLIGSGTAGDVIARHYAESLAALPLLDPGRRVIDLGSGAGFPGMVLAAARPDLKVWLVEARHKKTVFLESAARRAALSCSVLNVRVSASLPEDFPDAVDILTVRALRLGPQEWSALTCRMGRNGRILRWAGPAAPPPPEGFGIGRQVRIERSHRLVEELLREDRGTGIDV